MSITKRMATIIKAFDASEQAAKNQVLDAALAEIKGRVDVALEWKLHENMVEARAVADTRFPDKNEGAKRSQFVLVIETAANYTRLAEVARKAHGEAIAGGQKSSRVAGKYLVAAKLCRDTGKVPSTADVLAQTRETNKSAAIDLVNTRYKNLLKFATEHGVVVSGSLTFALAQAAPKPMSKEELAAALKASGISRSALAALMK